MFSLDEDQGKKLDEWIAKHNETCPHHYKPEVHGMHNPAGACGGTLTFKFTPTTLGMVTKVKCACNEEVDLSDYDSW